MSMFMQYAPYKLREGDLGRDQREQFADRCFDLLDEYAPNFKRSVIARQVLTPLDLERTFGLTGGNIFQGAMTLNQLFSLRPVPGYADYRTPVAGLYLCGAAAHPGGGVMGSPGLERGAGDPAPPPALPHHLKIDSRLWKSSVQMPTAGSGSSGATVHRESDASSPKSSGRRASSDPARLHPAAHVAGVAVLEQARVAAVHRQVGHHRLEPQVAVGDVQREDAARPEHVEVEPQGLPGEQVDRDRVRAEGVHQDHVVALLRPVPAHRLQADARVAQLQPQARRAVARVRRVGEVARIEGHVAHEAIDLVEGDAIAGARVGREGAGAEPDHRHAHRRRAPVELGEELADGTFALVVREGLRAPRTARGSDARGAWCRGAARCSPSGRDRGRCGARRRRSGSGGSGRCSSRPRSPISAAPRRAPPRGGAAGRAGARRAARGGP